MTKDSKSIVYAWMLILAACVVLIIVKGKIASGLESFSLNDTAGNNQVETLHTDSNLLSRLLIITLGNDQQQGLAVSSKALTRKLQVSNYFELVTNGQYETQSKQNDILFRYRYLLSDRFDRQPLDSVALKQALEALVPKTFSHLFQYNKDRLLTDPTGESDHLARSFHGKSSLTKAYGVWFNNAADTAIIMAYLKPAIGPGEQRQAMMERVMQEFEQSKSTQKQSIRLAGPATFTVISRNIIKSEVRFFTITGSLLVILLLYFSFRRKRIMLLVTVPVITAVLLATTVTILVFGSIHGITLAFGITLLGICIDYPIHLFSHARQDQTLRETILSIWPVIRLGVITTLSAFVLMLFSEMSGLVQLGLFTLSGIVAAALTTRWVLPRLINDTHQIQHYGLIPASHKIKSSKVFYYFLSAGIALSAILMYYNVSGSMIATSLTSLNPLPRRELQHYERLRKDIGLPQSYQYIAITGDTSEDVLREQERFMSELGTANHQVNSYLYAARYLPSIHTQNERKSALPDSAGMREMLRPMLSKLPFKDAAFEPFVNDVAQSRVLTPLAYEDMLKTYLGPTISSLLFKTQHGWTGLIFVDNTSDVKWTDKLLQAKYAKQIKYYNLKERTESLFNHYRDSIIDKAQIASLVILLVLLAGLRSFRKLLRVVMPVLLTIMLTMLIVYHMHGPLTIFHLIALILVFGICVDYSLFFNSGQDVDSDGRILHAISICVLSTLAVFGLLASSDVIVLRNIGFTVATGSILAYLISFFYSTSAA